MSTPALSDSRLANVGARALSEAWAGLATRFRIITRRARIRFAERDWRGMAADAGERLELYTGVSREIAGELTGLLSERVSDKQLWAGMKAVYSGLISERDDWEVAETFFNSVTRRIFTTVGVDPRIEFVDTDFDVPPTKARRSLYTTYEGAGPTASLVERIVRRAFPKAEFADLQGDAARAAGRIEDHLRAVGALRAVDRIDGVDSVFYRGKGAYLVGRLYSGSHVLPLILALLHPRPGLVIDAVLLTENDASILFSFTRAYFHVDVERPHDLVAFLRSLMPRKRVAELYTAIGHHKHGKTELYRDLLHHLATSEERFEIARGARGMVMSVFTLPGFDVVFKVIKDHFPPPKNTTRTDVRSRYRLVFRHDRAGRLIDAQEFEHLEFSLDRFRPDLLQVLLADCGGSVRVSGGSVEIVHAYVERRVIPLDVYVREAALEAAKKAILDYGQSIKDMAASGIFPGDMLLKNFGVTRHGRVVFYDYDELTRLEVPSFRVLPAPTTPEEEVAAEPWFSVGPRDVFPEEFPPFLGLSGELRAAFLARHGDLYRPETWQGLQRRVAAGEMIDIYPYGEESRLKP